MTDDVVKEAAEHVKHGISAETCNHEPIGKGIIYPGKTTKCAKCGIDLIGSNRPAGSKVRMSKKERRKMKAERNPGPDGDAA